MANLFHTLNPVHLRHFTSTPLPAHSGFILSIEASQLYRLVRPSRLYDDAMDIGFAIFSERTGKTEIFSYSKSVRENDELLYDVFSCLSNPKIVVHVFNT